MSIEAELASLSPTKGMLLAIGVFDGVHIGHKHLLSELVRQARQRNLISGVITFGQHPKNVLKAGASRPFLTSLPQKIKLLKEQAVEVVITLSFTLELAQLGSSQFISLLRQHLKMQGLVLGPDFALGRNREGDIEALRALSKSQDFSLTVVPHAVLNGEIVSSTAIRNALAGGNIEKVHRMLGRYFSLEGKVITGSGRGAELGFPTANLDINPGQALPADGIYVSRAHIDNRQYQAVTNIGKRPTFDETERTVETYILDYRGDLYRRQLKVDIIQKLRDEERFATIAALKKQIEQDIKRARAILDGGDKR
jgi:riboflavin kinase/FMN adenylyltransferase